MTSATNTTRRPPNLRDAVKNLLFAGPSYPEVAAVLLGDALKVMYPTLDLNPRTTVVGEPLWDLVDGEVVELGTRYDTLSNMLAGQMDENDSICLIEGEHFLTRLPITHPVVHLPVRIDQIGNLINELVPVMLPAFQEQQLMYWNTSVGAAGPRWRELSNTLRKFWDVKQVKGWTAAECNMARQLFLCPSLDDRKLKDPYATHAYLIDMDAVDGNQAKHLFENTIVVLIGQIDNKEVILTYSILNGYQRFDSAHALGQSLPGYLSDTRASEIKWRLYEPNGNIFDHKACGLVDMQIQVISSPAFVEDDTSQERPPPRANAQLPNKDINKAWLEVHTLDWLKAASIADQFQFAQHLKDLSALNSTHAGATYRDDIPFIKAFALSALKKQILSDHPDASALDLNKIEIEIRSAVLWGTFAVPGKIDTTRLSLVELALQNLIALPLGDKTVRLIDGHALPTWMTVDYLKSVITKIDIGRVYPELVKQKLLDDPAQASRRENLYTSQLRVQLPMLALENKIRQMGNIDERGYRYVAALMEPNEEDRKVNGQPVVLRRLAFISKQLIDTEEDVVANMFVIGPKDPDAGPYLLYRPLLEPQLCQYPSSTNLLYAIRQTASLRQSVLAWLPDDVRNHYSRYVFPTPLPSPWIVVDFLADPVDVLLSKNPVSLSTKALEADFLPLLYKANANALAELADRQSVSDSESRWESFKQAGWLIFNLALPYLGTTVGTAVWLSQILDDVETLEKSSEEADSQTKWEVFVDLLLNLSAALTTHAIDRARKNMRSRQTETPEVVRELHGLKPAKPITIERVASVTETLPTEHYEAIHSIGALSDASQETAKILETFAVTQPEQTGVPSAEGPFAGLYEREGEWHANMAGKWVKVKVEGEQVYIVDPMDPTRTGPPLTSDTFGQWRIDTRLRLHSGGSKGARQKVITEAKAFGIEKLAELNQLEQRKVENQQLLTMEAQALEQASGPSRARARDTFVATLRTQQESFENALEILRKWPVYQAMPDAPRKRRAYLNAQVSVTFEEMAQLKETFTPVLAEALKLHATRVRVTEQRHVETATSMIRVGDDMIICLDYMETRFTELKKLGAYGFESVHTHRPNMPSYRSYELRLIQLDMYRHLCLSINSFYRIPEGWHAINQVVDNAKVAFQSLNTLVGERSRIRLDEQIDAYGSLVEQSSGIEEHLDYISSEYQDSVRPADLTRLTDRIRIFQRGAQDLLAQSLFERDNQRSQGALYQQRPTPRKKFIRARFWGLVSGEPRLLKGIKETDWLDVRDPFTNEIIVTFHRKENGEWVPHVDATLSEASEVFPALSVSLEKGQALIDGLDEFKTQLQERIEQPDRTPAGIGMILNAHANRMEVIGVAINKALERAANETVGISAKQEQEANSMRQTLKRESSALYQLGNEIVLKIIKQSPPTMNDVVWLKDRQLISIKKVTSRQRNKGHLAGYLDRYEIKDVRERKTLWFAEFRYSTDWVPDSAYLSGRLKTPEQVKEGATVKPTKGMTNRQLIAQYRSEIAVDQAKAVFFS
ncbi:DUF6543 domain-containing protein [Pseudomonas sp. T1.Ur]|uniref:dermonecrotic toxin domain-containing protein n=1 Tax=Pseudomonas sp. T1.Ur TaxID=2928704 RepID=UPI00201E3E03|nr:DUF6543 domain-containing protein [Pseudomonas sp. T1.Ur]MCL6704779.1 hypothetical protein [Pseudomonas sp. T1.Ur]